MWPGFFLIAGYPTRAKLRQRLRRFVAQTRDCRAVQTATLRRILGWNRDSAFSRRYGLSDGLSAAEFRRRWPVAGAPYEVFRPWIERVAAGEPSVLLGAGNRLLMFGTSSGTTSRSKLIPITRPFLSDYRRGWQVWSAAALGDHPSLKYGRFLQISSSHRRSVTSAGVPCGNISGLVASLQSPLIRSLYPVPVAVNELADPDAKLYLTLRLSVGVPDVRLAMTANPSTLVRLGRLLQAHATTLIRDLADGSVSEEFPVPASVRRRLRWRLRADRSTALRLQRRLEERGTLRPADVWPGLEVVSVWTGGSCGLYLPELGRLYGNAGIRDHGLSATEGRITIPLQDGQSSGVLDVGSHFFEFIPVAEYGRPQPTVLLADELVEGECYYVLLTTLSGLYRYDICDVVRCDGFFETVPCLTFLHKGRHVANLTGEKLTEQHVVQAVQRVAAELGIPVPQFCVIPRFAETPYYAIVVEASAVPPGDCWLPRLDAHLCGLNCEYEEKRRSQRLREICCIRIGDGAWESYAAFRRRKGGGSFEQYKHPCLLPTIEEGDELLSVVEGVAAAESSATRSGTGPW